MNTDFTDGSSLRASNQSGNGPFLTGNHSGTNPPTNSVSDVTTDSAAATGWMEFRVSRVGQPPRRLRLTGNRYTFGNADGCTIRLKDAALRPMHAVLIREPMRVLVRTYSVPVEVNGSKTTEAELNVGDVLRLGVYEFELISARFAGDGASTRTLGHSAVANESVLSPPRRNLPPVDEVVWRERLRREVDQWRQRQEDCDRRESRIDEREAELRARESELWSRSDNLHRRETRIQSQEVETFQLYDDFTQRQQELIQLREESQNRQAEISRREAEFREQEFEYRRRLAEANTQLDQSKLQAEAATLAVTRMREQFDALNAQIEQLSKDQVAIDSRDYVQREEYERVRQELESAKAEAEQNHQASQRQRLEAEDRVAELTVEIDQLRSTLASEQGDQHAELEESKRITDELRNQVSELQETVTRATEESERLRCDYEQSCEKVVQLETLVSESRQRGDEDREQWETETQQLRAEVDRLSSDLTAANQQLEEIRQANHSLNDRLNQVRQERDDARVERDARPTTDAYQQLRNELETASNQLNEMQRQYEEALAKLDKPDAASDSSIPKALGLIDDTASEDCSNEDSRAVEATSSESAESSLAIKSADESTWNAPENDLQRDPSDQPAESLWSSQQPTSEDGEPSADDGEDEVWPTYQSADIPAAFDGDDNQGERADAPEAIPSADVDGSVAPNLAITVDLPPSTETNWGRVDTTDETNHGHSEWSAPDQPNDDNSIEKSIDQLPRESAEADQAAADPWHSAVTSDHETISDSCSIDQSDDAGSISPATNSSDLWASHSLGSDDEIPAPRSDVPETEPEAQAVDDETAWPATLEDHSDPVDALAAAMSSSAEIREDSTDSPDANENSSDDDVGSPELTSEEPGWAPIEPSITPLETLDEPTGDDPIENSIVQGSLASALIQDLESENSDESVSGADRESELHQAGEFPAATHEGTFVMSDHPETPLWAADRIADVVPPAELRDASDNFATPEMTLPWDNVAQEDGEDIVADSSSEDAFDSADDDDSNSAIEVTGVMNEDEPVTAESVAGSADEDDDSIEAYMNRLLRRVQGDDSPDAEAAIPEAISVSTSQSTNAFSKSTDQSETGEGDADSLGLTQSTPIDSEAPLVPRSQAPERSGNLSAMRDLANSSARSAISRSARVQSRDTQIQAMVSFACAIGALGCNIFAFYFLSGFLLILAVSMTVIVAFCCFREGAQLMAEARRRVQAANSNVHSEGDTTSDG